MRAGNAGENWPALGCERWENTLSRGSVGARFHPEGFSVCVRTGQTGRHWPWSLALQPVSPPVSSDGCWTASPKEPHHRARCRGVTEERVAAKKKGWGRWILPDLMKNCGWFHSSGGVIQDQPASFLFLFKLSLEGKNPPTPALFPHSAPRHSPFGFSLHGKIHSFSLLTFSFFMFFSCDKKGNLNRQTVFPSFPPSWKYSGEIVKSWSVSAQPWKTFFS